MVPKRAFSALKSSSTCKKLEGPEELHLDMQQLVGERKVMPKRECPTLKSPPAGTRLDKSGELHPVMQQTAMDGFSHPDCTKSTNQGRNYYFQADVKVNSKTTTPQVTVRLVARLPVSRQQQGITLWSNKQNKQFDVDRCFRHGDDRVMLSILCASFCFCLSVIFLDFQ